MKKRLIAAAFCLLLLCSLPVFACADELFPAPEPVEAGYYFEHRLASLSADGSASLAEGSLPAGVELIREETAGGADIWLRGTPTAAGKYNLIIDLNGSRTMIALTVLPATPMVNGGGMIECATGETVTLQISAHTADGGAMSYQWFRAADASGSGAVVIQGATGSSRIILDRRIGPAGCCRCLGHDGSNDAADQFFGRSGVGSRLIHDRHRPAAGIRIGVCIGIHDRQGLFFRLQDLRLFRLFDHRFRRRSHDNIDDVGGLGGFRDLC